MTAKPKWTRTVPPDVGYYWCRFQHRKYGETMTTPCHVIHLGRKEWIVFVFLYVDFYSHTPGEMRRHNLRFGPPIPMPEE